MYHHGYERKKRMIEMWIVAALVLAEIFDVTVDTTQKRREDAARTARRHR
jgi:hypothetical protein